MSEKKAVGTKEKGGNGTGRAGKRAAIDRVQLVQQVASRTISENLNEIIVCLLYNIKDMHLPSVKLLFDIIGFEFDESSLIEEAYDSLAKVLMALYQKQLVGASLDESEKRLALVGNVGLGSVREGIVAGGVEQN